MIYFIHTYTEVPMDKSDQNAPDTSVGAAMAEATAAKEAEVIKVDATDIEIIEYIVDVSPDETPLMYQGIAIYGSQLVSAKFLEIVKHAIAGDDFLKEDIVKIIVFSQNQPIDQHDNPMFACYKPPEKMIAFNLQQHFDGAVQLVKEVDGYMSLRGHIWYNMILSLFHELYHGLFIATDAEKEMVDHALKHPKMDELEAACNDMADDALTALAREYDIEPPPMGDEPFFGLRYMEFYIREIKEGKDAWCLRQDALHDDVNIHYDDERKEYIKLFRSFIRYTHGGDSDQKDPTWDTEPLALMPLAEAEPLAAEAIIDVQPQPVVGAQFHGADAEQAVEDYDDTLGLDDSAYSTEDYDTLPPEAAGFNAQATAPVVAPVEAVVAASVRSLQCIKCANALTAAMKFCGNCGEATTAPWDEPLPAQTVVAQTFVAPVTTTAAQHVIGTQPAGSVSGHRGAPGQILPTNLPNHNFTPEAFRTVVEQILFHLYAHLFNKCGYAGGMVNPCFDDAGKWGILERVSVAHIPDADRVLYACDFLDQQRIQRTMVPINDGMISGFCTKKGMLPAYTVYFNANGNCIKRVLLPQNSWKEKAGALSSPALRAQQGALIAWIMDGDDNTTKKFRGRIENSVFNWS
jgi:hypothetical protein